jgi:chromosome segregation ATPase
MAKASTSAPSKTNGNPQVQPARLNFTPEQLRARFWEINKELANHEKSIAPVQEQYEKLRQEEAEIQAKQQPLQEKLKGLRQPVYELKNEQAMIVRALGGRTGPDPDAPQPQPVEKSVVEDSEVSEDKGVK